MSDENLREKYQSDMQKTKNIFCIKKVSLMWVNLFNEILGSKK